MNIKLDKFKYENKTNKDSTMSGFLLGASTKIILQIDTGNSMLDLIRNSPSWKQIISNNTIDNSKIMITSYYGSNIRVVSIPILNLVANNQETCYNIYINAPSFRRNQGRLVSMWSMPPKNESLQWKNACRARVQSQSLHGLLLVNIRRTRTLSTVPNL